MVLWTALAGSAVVIPLAELLLLHLQRNLLTADPHRRRFFVRYMQRQPPEQPLAVDPPHSESPPVHPEPVARPVTAVHPRRQQGILYVDPHGHCTSANQAARDLLHWRGGELALSDVLGGGLPESTELLASLAQHGVIAHYAATLAGTSPAPLDIDALALRDRDENFWGAALFIRRLPAEAPRAGRSPQ